jgi:hypothetical protein
MCLDIFPTFPVIHTVKATLATTVVRARQLIFTFIELGKRPLISAGTISLGEIQTQAQSRA